MGMTMTQKILANAAGKESVKAGELIMANLNLVLGNDITTPVAIGEFDKIGLDGVFDKAKVALVPDHFTPNKDIKSAQQALKVRTFAKEQDIVNYFEVGEVGIEHALLPEKGLVVAGDVVIGADSHTCTYGALGAFSTGMGSTDVAVAMAMGKTWLKVPSTFKVVVNGKFQNGVYAKDLILHLIGLIGADGATYKALEFHGETIENMSMADRFTLANMAVEAGAKAGLFMTDEKTKAYLKERGREDKFIEVKPDSDAVYERVIELSLIHI